MTKNSSFASIETQLASMITSTIKDKENDALLAKFHDNREKQETLSLSPYPRRYYRVHKEHDQGTNIDEEVSTYFSSDDNSTLRNFNTRRTLSPVAKNKVRGWNYESYTNDRVYHEEKVEVPQLSLQQWITIYLPHRKDVVDSKFLSIALPSDPEELRSILSATVSDDNDDILVVGLVDSTDYGQQRVYPLSVLCSGNVQVDSSHCYEPLMSRRNSSKCANDSFFSSRPHKVYNDNDLNSDLDRLSKPFLSNPNCKDIDEKRERSTDIVSGKGEEDSFPSQKLEEEEEKDYISEFISSDEELKDFLLAFILHYTDGGNENDEVSLSSILIPNYFRPILEALVKEGDSVIHAAYVVSEYCDDDEYLRCMMCTIAHNVVVEFNNCGEVDRNFLNSVGHKDLENILDAAFVLIEQHSLSTGKFIALLHAILVKEEPIVNAYHLHLKIGEYNDAIDVLLGALYEIGLSLLPVSRSDKLVEIEEKDQSSEMNESNDMHADEKSNNGVELFELIKIYSDKLLGEGRLCVVDRQIIQKLIEEEDECLMVACKLYIEDLNEKVLERTILSRVNVARNERKFHVDQNVTDENESLDMEGIFEEAVRLLVQYKRIDDTAALALHKSWKMGNSVLLKICNNFIKGGSATIFMDMLEDLVKPYLNSRKIDSEVSDPILKACRLSSQQEQVFEQIVSILYSTDLIAKEGAFYLRQLAKKGSLELIKALSVGFPSDVNEEVDEMIKALIELANNADACVDKNETKSSPPQVTIENLARERLEPMNNIESSNTTKIEKDSNDYVSIPQALDDTQPQFTNLLSKCIDILGNQGLVTNEEMLLLVDMGNRRDAKLASAFDAFHKSGDLDILLDQILFIVRALVDKKNDSFDRLQNTKNDDSGIETVNTQSFSTDFTHDESLYVRSTSKKIKAAAEAFVSDLFEGPKVIDEGNEDPLYSDLLKEVKDWHLNESESFALKKCIERKDPLIVVALNTLRANNDRKQFEVSLKHIARDFIAKKGDEGFSHADQ